MNTLESVSIANPYGDVETCGKFVVEDVQIGFLLDDIAIVGQQYTLQFWIKSTASASVTVCGKTFSTSTSWKEYTVTFTADSTDLIFLFSAAGTYYMFEPQLEIGNQKTDYSEAPEDAEVRLENNIKVTAAGLQGNIAAVEKNLGDTETRLQNNIDITAGRFNVELSKRVLQTEYDGKMQALDTEITSIKTEAGNLKVEVGKKVTQTEVDASIDAIEEFHGTTVDITGSGFAIKTGGTFTVDSKKFDIDENGEMSAVNARISGQLSVDGNDVWHKGVLIVSTATPSNPTSGMIWVKPDMSAIPAAGTWSLAALTSRPDKWTSNYDYALSGTNIGAAPSNATYTYEVSVPVYYGYNGSGSCDVTVYLGASSGATTVSMGTKTFSDANKGGNMYTATVTSGTWLGNAGTIYMRVNFSAPNLMTVNSHSPFTCTLTAKSSSATGWKVCEVQMYTG